MNAAKKLAPVFALMAATGLTAVLPETANAQTPVYTQTVPSPSVAIPSTANNNYYEAAVPQDYYGPAMTQQGMGAVAAEGPRTKLYYARKGFTEATLTNGEHIGIEYTLDPNGYAYIMDPRTNAYDLNNRDDLQRWNNTVNMWTQDNADKQAAYESAVAANTYYGPAVYTGSFRPCWNRGGRFEVAVAIGGFGVEVFDPYAYSYGRPVIIEPVFYGRSWAYERMMLERERFYNRMHYPYGGGGVNIFVHIGGHRGVWDERLPGHFRPFDSRPYGHVYGGRDFDHGRRGDYQPRNEPHREYPGSREPFNRGGRVVEQHPREQHIVPREQHVVPRNFEPHGGRQAQHGERAPAHQR
jgi:hypothetical protein